MATHADLFNTAAGYTVETLPEIRYEKQCYSAL
jgi:hypothetical protein